MGGQIGGRIGCEDSFMLHWDHMVGRQLFYSMLHTPRFMLCLHNLNMFIQKFKLKNGVNKYNCNTIVVP